MRNNRDLKKSRNMQIFFWKATYIRELITHSRMVSIRKIMNGTISSMWKHKWRKNWYYGIKNDE